MTGERDLRILRRHLAPSLHPARFVFCRFKDFRLPAGLHPIGLFREDEGLTAMVPEQEAISLSLPHEFPARLITLTVQSDLHAVGLIAAVLSLLTAASVPCNVVSAFHHDHLFVPAELAPRAMQVLVDWSARGEEPAAQRVAAPPAAVGL